MENYITVAYDKLETWLAEQEANTPETAYSVKITEIPSTFVNDIKTKLKTREDVYLDLSVTELPSVPRMVYCFENCTSLTKAPATPNGVEFMTYCFSGCTSLIEAPVISSSVTHMSSCFRDCTSLTEAPVLPNSVININSCFQNCTSLTGAPAIPNGVTNMSYCFRNCTSLTKAPVIPNGVRVLAYCFSGCASLIEAPVIPKDVYNVERCFENCTLLTEAPVIPSDVEYMNYCFSGCTSLTKAPVIPDSVTSMFKCFYGCTSLTKAPVIPDSVTKMDNCFYGCTSLIEVYIELNESCSVTDCFKGSAVTQIYTDKIDLFKTKLDTEASDYVFKNLVRYENLDTFLASQEANSQYRPLDLKIIEIPDTFVSDIATKINARKDVYLDLSKTELPSVTSMKNCFYNCSSLVKAPVLGNNVLDMTNCFQQCTSLQEVSKIPDTVTNMKFCFQNCSSLMFSPEIPDGVTDIESCFENCYSLLQSPVIPNSVTNMTCSFMGCDSLTEAPVIPNGVTNMYGCFGYCPLLKKAPVIPDSVINMNLCFNYCTSLTKAPKIPNSVTHMTSCFRDCTSLTETPVIPSNVEYMDNCFEECTSLVEVSVFTSPNVSMANCFKNSGVKTVYTDNITIVKEQLGESADLLTIKPYEVPYIALRDILAELKASSVEKPTSLKIIEFENDVRFLAEYIKTRPDVYLDLSETELPEIESLYECFNGCSNLVKSPAIPSTTTELDSCFQGCSSLVEAPEIPNGVLRMESCFENCTSLSTGSEIPDSVISMSRCFYGCTALEEVFEIGENVYDMSGCFYNCSSLKGLYNVPSSVKGLYSCFEGCSSLETIYNWEIMDMTDVTVDNVFSGCTSLKNIYVRITAKQTDKYKLCQLNVTDDEIEYSIIDSDLTKEISGTIDGTAERLTIEDLTDEFAIGESGQITKELAKKTLEYKTQFSNLEKDFSPDDPHMVLWAKDPDKVKNNTTKDALNLPCGTILPYYSSNIPDGWLLCDGSEFDPDRYPALYILLNDNHTPNLIGKYLQGNATAGTEIEAGLPNITGLGNIQGASAGGTATGAFKVDNRGRHASGSSQNSNYIISLSFDASSGETKTDGSIKTDDEHHVYGKSDTVTPPSVTVLYIIKATSGLTNGLEDITVQNVKDYVDTTAQNVKEYVDETREIKVTSLWTGNSSTSAQTIKLSQPYTDFTFIIVEGMIYSPVSQRSYAVIPSIRCNIATSGDGDEFLIAGSTAGTSRRLRFSFPTTTSLYKLASEGTEDHLPIITNVWGVK